MKKGTIDSIYSLAQSAVTDSAQSTLKFLSRSGIQAKITRTAHAGCCEACAALAGSWVYGKESKEIYRRHKYCTCTVSYDPGNGRVQNVHSKVWTTITPSAKIGTASQNKPKDSVEKATGKAKGSPLSIQDAVSGANPNYSKGWEYQNNCQRCVQAYELRRRGYNVTAQKKIKSGDTVVWGAECFTASGTDSEAKAAFSFSQTEAQIKKTLAGAPDGSRYVIYVRWKGSKYAHVFIAEKEGATVRYVDPQTGSTDCSGYFSQGSRGKFGLFRLDDKTITMNLQAIRATVEG